MLSIGNHFKAFKQIRNYTFFLKDDLGLSPANDYCLHLKNGMSFVLRSRKQTRISDLDIFCEVVLNNEYSLEDKLNDHSIIVDVGGHIGLFASQAGKLAKMGRVISYEPVPENFLMLTRNIQQNYLSNILCVNKAVSGDGANLKIYIEDWNTGAHSQYTLQTDKKFHESSTVTMKDIFITNNLDRVDLMKIDCEGGEYEFLLKAPDEYLLKIKKIVMEQHLTDAIKKIYAEDVLIKRLKSVGFQVSLDKKIFYPGEGEFYLISATR